MQYIETRRGETPPVSFARIADELRDKTGEYITHEIPRRWYNAAHPQDTDQAA